jgi:hypothetical protein
MPFRQDREATPPAAFVTAMRQVIERELPGLWIYGTRDPALAEFHAFRDGLPGPARDRAARWWTVRVVADANHDFTSVPWTAQVLDATRDWLAGLTAPRPSPVPER